MFRVTAILCCGVLFFALRVTAADDDGYHDDKVNVNVELGPPVDVTTGDQKLDTSFDADAYAPPPSHARGHNAGDGRKSNTMMNKDSYAPPKHNDDNDDDKKTMSDDSRKKANVELDHVNDGRKLNTAMGTSAYAPPKSPKSEDDDDEGDVNVDVDYDDSAATPTESDEFDKKLNTAMNNKSYAPPSDYDDDDDVKNQNSNVKVDVEVDDRRKHGNDDDEDDDGKDSSRPVSALDLPIVKAKTHAILPPKPQNYSEINKEMMVVVIDFSKNRKPHQ